MRMDEMSAVFAVGLGAFFRPSVLVVSPATVVPGQNSHQQPTMSPSCFFGILSVSTHLSMEIYAALRRMQGVVLLSRLDAWMDRHTNLIIVVGAIALGLPDRPPRVSVGDVDLHSGAPTVRHRARELT